MWPHPPPPHPFPHTHNHRRPNPNNSLLRMAIPPLFPISPTRRLAHCDGGTRGSHRAQPILRGSRRSLKEAGLTREGLNGFVEAYSLSEKGFISHYSFPHSVKGKELHKIINVCYPPPMSLARRPSLGKQPRGGNGFPCVFVCVVEIRTVNQNVLPCRQIIKIKFSFTCHIKKILEKNTIPVGRNVRNK